jgi:hypothetical protein
MGLMLTQLLSDNTGPGLLKSIMEHKDLYFLRTIQFRSNHPFRYGCRHVELGDDSRPLCARSSTIKPG